MAVLIGMSNAAWKRQPSGIVRINDAHPLAKNCVDAFIPSDHLESARKAKGTRYTISTAVSSPGKIYQQLTDVDKAARIDYGNLSQYQITGDLTLFCRFYISAIPLTTNRGLIAKWRGVPSAQRSYALVVDYQTDNLNPTINGAVSNTGSFVAGSNLSGSTILTTHRYYNAYFVYKPSTSVSLYLDGVLDAQKTTSIVATIFNSTTELWIGNNFSLTTAGLSYYSILGGIESAAIWNRALSVDEIRAFDKNIYQIYQSAPSRFYLIPSAGGATTHDAALTLAYIASCQPAATAQFNAGITLATLAGAMSGKTAQFNSSLSLDTNVSLTLAKALSTLATVQLDITADQSVSALNDAVAAITESIACNYTSSVTANLLASLSFGITQALINSTGGTLAAALSLALNAGTQASATAAYSADVTLLTTLQTALQAALATTANLTLPATLTITIDGERIADTDVSLALDMQAGMTTSATAIMSAQLTLATHLLATPSGVASFQSAVALANTLSTAFTTGNTIQSALSLAVSLAMADAASVTLGGSLQLGLVLNQVQAAIASLTATTSFPIALDVPLSGGMAMEAGIALGWTLGFTSEGAYFEITVTLPTGRIILISASERMINITASERLIVIPPNDPIISI